MSERVQLYHGDCLEVMKGLPAGSVDAVITDPPYGTTACKWDAVIPFAPMWECIAHVLKPDGACVLTSSDPFTSLLVTSNLKWFKYKWVWDKVLPSGFNNAKWKPMQQHEDICVFGRGAVTYNPIMWRREKIKRSTATPSESNPLTTYDGIKREYTHSYPKSIISISNADHSDRLHPTQKPVSLMKYLIRTYTNEGETVLDFTMGSGSTGEACIQTGRRFIGIEKDPQYFAIAQKRIAEAQMQELLPL